MLIDRIPMNRLFLGIRRITNVLCDVGHLVNRKRVQRLMQKMSIQAIYPKPNTSKLHAKHKIYPYLLRNLTIDRPNQVWATDITHIPMPQGFVYLTVIVDWYSRKVYPGAFQIAWIPSFVLMPLRRPYITMASQKSLTVIRVGSLRVRTLRAWSKRKVFLSAWMAKARIGQWIEFYNRDREHQTLGKTPDMIYGSLSNLKKAA